MKIEIQREWKDTRNKAKRSQISETNLTLTVKIRIRDPVTFDTVVVEGEERVIPFLWLLGSASLEIWLLLSFLCPSILSVFPSLLMTWQPMSKISDQILLLNYIRVNPNKRFIHLCLGYVFLFLFIAFLHAIFV